MGKASICLVAIAILFSGTAALRSQESGNDFVFADPPTGSESAYESPAPCPTVDEGPICSCGQCQCFPWEVPPKPAPCIECPHVSTLQPFWNVNIFGTLQGNVMMNTARAVAPGIPIFLLPNVAPPENTVDIFARSSSLGAAVVGPDIGNFKTGGVVLGLFYNDALIVDRYGFLPIQAYGELKNEEWRFAAGLQFNVFNPNLPNMLTFSAMIASGNAGNNFPGQVRIERFIHTGEESQITIQGALSDPVATGVVSNTPISALITGAPPLRLTEDNGWPTLEGRIAYSAGAIEMIGLQPRRKFEIGVSALGGQLRTAIPFNPNVVANTYGLGTDAYWRITDRFGVQGELFVGESLGFQNGGVLQNANSATFTGIRTRGGWGEVYYYLTPRLHSHWGYGVDNPIDADLANSQITRNRTAFSNLIWDVTAQLRFGFEFTWRATDYVLLPDNQGTGYHSQVQWTF